MGAREEGLSHFRFVGKGRMKIVVTITGKDQVGIVAMVSTALAAHKVNILDINQNTMADFFNMIMIADATDASVSLKDLQSMLRDKGEAMGLEIKLQHEDIFNCMHKI